MTQWTDENGVVHRERYEEQVEKVNGEWVLRGTRTVWSPPYTPTKSGPCRCGICVEKEMKP